MTDVVLAPSRRAWLLAGLLAGFYFLLGFKRSFSAIGIGLALYGTWLLIRRHKALLDNPAQRAALAVAAAFALPLLFSLVDAPFLALSAEMTGHSLLYLPILIAVVALVQEQRVSRPFLWLATGLVAFWAVDGLVQLVTGVDLFGRPYHDRIGAYWLSPMKFGYYMGFFGLVGVAALAVLRPRQPFLLAGFWGITALGVLIGGNREAWLMFFPFSGLLFWVHIARLSRYRYALLAGGAALAVALAFSAYELSPTVRDRVAQSVAGLKWDYEAIDAASSRRLELWRIAAELIEAHPVNGSGMDAYQSYFPQMVQDPLWKASTTAPYPHQYLLEIGAATGVMGWLGVLVIAGVVVRAWRQASLEDKQMAWPAVIYLMALWFPLNTHRSFYSSELIMGNCLMLGFILGNLLPAKRVRQKDSAGDQAQQVDGQ